MIGVANIDGLRITPLRIIADDRGAVMHMLRADSAEFTRFGECYFSEVNPGAVKAWKRHRTQAQNLAVPVGRIRVVVFDGREGSPTVGNRSMLELGRPDAYVRLSIPPLLWYGIMGLGTAAALIVNCPDLPHDPNESEMLPLDALDTPALALLRAECRSK
jgi:dTDP-4-dehydrorhamnose 3,5-epimerase